MKHLIFFIYVVSVVFLASPLFAVDYGAVFNGQFTMQGNDETETSGSITLAPWLAMPLGDGDFYLSAGVHADYSDTLIFVPELFRLELSLHLLDSLSLRAGRIPWQDTSHFTAKGNFDGIDLIFDMGTIRFGAAVLYTGLLYKETAEINTSPGDPKDYNIEFDWAEFADSYFAPRRVVTSLYGEFPGWPYERGHVYAGLLAQFDLSDAEEKYHSQYLLLRHSLVYKTLDFVIAGAVQLEHTEYEGLRTAYALSAEAGIQGPGSLSDRFSLGLRWASGDGPHMAAFFPLIREAQGTVLKPHFSGIMVIRANYQALLFPTFSAQLGGRYLLRTDSSTFSDPDLTDDSYLLGAEIDGSLLWIPFSDLSISLAGGIFLPQTGGAMNSDAPVRWTISLGTIFSF